MEEKSQKVSLIDEAITRYFEKKKKNELIILDTIDRINSKKAAAFEMADATYSTIIEKRQNAITHINEQVDLIFEKREKEKNC
ncbi:hypothetical protein LJR153_007259 [Paenibacillus sp. LjRoot153]|uniref:hypothetical protein n=1 Tax=Paenibacillus sp. LjRoot153 TaxID=3342270 RepID=UPI003ECDEFE9